MPGPVVRRVAVVLALLVVVALAVSVAFALFGEWRVGRSASRFESVLGPPDLSRFTKAEIPRPDNAATWLLAGAGAVVPAGEARGILGLGGELGGEWSAEESDRIRVAVELNAPALELLRRSVACADSSYSLDYERGPDAELPPFLELLRAAGLIWLDGRLALLDGDTPRLRSDLEALDRLADSLASESFLITAIIAFAVDRHYLDLVHRWLERGGENDALLAEVEAVLAGRDRRRTYLRALAADGSMVFSMSSDRLLEEDGLDPRQWLWRQVSRPARRLLMAALIDEFSAVAELVEKPWPEVVAASEERSERGFPESFAVTLYPNLIDAMGKLKAGESVGRLAIEAIRNRRAFLAAGVYPAGRGEPLVDPYSGRTVVVERRPDGSLVLEAPAALELWRASHSGPSRLGDPPFMWELPATP